jgi:hypothetical protein
MLNINHKEINYIYSIIEKELKDLSLYIENINSYPYYLKIILPILYLSYSCKLFTYFPDNEIAKKSFKLVSQQLNLDLDYFNKNRLITLAQLTKMKFYLLESNLDSYIMNHIIYFNNILESKDIKQKYLIEQNFQDIIKNLKDDKIVIKGVKPEMPIYEILLLENIDKIALCYFIYGLKEDNIKLIINEDMKIIDSLVKLIFKYNDRDIRFQIINVLKYILNYLDIQELIKIIINNCNQYHTLLNEDIKLYIQEILFEITEYISYPEFYKAWHSNNENIHPEVKEITPVGKDEITNKLNQQITDIYSNLKTNLKAKDNTYPL